MSWVSAITTFFYYLLLPAATLLRWLFIALAPLFHLGTFIASGFLMPLSLLAKFETLYIYLGVAAVVGLVTGSILHISSTILVSLFNLTPTPEERGRSAASVRAAREQQKLEEAWQSTSFKSDQGRLGFDSSLEKHYAEWVDNESGKRREDQKLFKQTILEEEDDSDEGL